VSVCSKYKEDGLADNSINVKLTGSAGQSFCAFLVRGVTVVLEGDANDYVGKVRAATPMGASRRTTAASPTVTRTVHR